MDGAINNRTMNQFFWNAYKRLEKEVLALSEDIHFSDDQLGVYSSKIGDLLVRIAIEFCPDNLTTSSILPNLLSAQN